MVDVASESTYKRRREDGNIHSQTTKTSTARQREAQEYLTPVITSDQPLKQEEHVGSQHKADASTMNDEENTYQPLIPHRPMVDKDSSDHGYQSLIQHMPPKQNCNVPPPLPPKPANIRV